MSELLAGEKHADESDRAVAACNDYLLMGPGRSLTKLHRNYTETTPESAPSKNFRWIKEWSSSYGWVKRARAYDAATTVDAHEEATRLMKEGLAAPYERVRQLAQLAAILLKQIVKQGDAAPPSLIAQWRGLLDDIAKETGGRQQRGIVSNLNIPWESLNDEQLQRIANGEDPSRVLASA